MSGHIQVHECAEGKNHIKDREVVGAYGGVRCSARIIYWAEYGLIEIGLAYGGIPMVIQRK
jgi:hypothetical protein